jgi:hypothetical protein
MLKGKVKIMLEIKVTTVEIPMAETMHEVAYQNKKEKVKVYTEEERRSIERGWEHLPYFIHQITEKIKRVSEVGSFGCEISLVDDVFLDSFFYKHINKRRIDKRVDYRFDGTFTQEMAQVIKETFKKAGYWIEACPLQVVNSSCYRSGKIEIYWR